MGYDWKRLEGEDSQRGDRVALSLGITYLVILAVGTLVLAVLGRLDDDWPRLLTAAIIAAPLLVIGIVRTRRGPDRDRSG